MVISTGELGLFQATATIGREKKTTFKHRTDSEFAEQVATRQRIQGGAKSPHTAKRSEGPPVKRVKK
jgi:hypothetical protein